MRQEDKQLLLKDLCARLPYNVVIRCTDNDNDYKCFLTPDILNELLHNIEYYDYKPYLRPLLSMTEEEEKEIARKLNYEFYVDEDAALCAEDGRHRISLDLIEIYIEWLNAHHFDYRGLIEKGLAIEAPKDIYEKK